MSRLARAHPSHLQRAGAAGLLCIALALAAPAAEAGDTGTRVTTRFALKQVRPALQRVAKLCTQGFDRATADKLAAQIEALPTEKAHGWEFTAQCRGQTHSLNVRALVDELSRTDLDFATDAAFAAMIREALGDLATR